MIEQELVVQDVAIEKSPAEDQRKINDAILKDYYNGKRDIVAVPTAKTFHLFQETRMIPTKPMQRLSVSVSKDGTLETYPRTLYVGGDIAVSRNGIRYN